MAAVGENVGSGAGLELGGRGSFGCRKIYLEATLLKKVELNFVVLRSQYNIERLS